LVFTQSSFGLQSESIDANKSALALSTPRLRAFTSKHGSVSIILSAPAFRARVIVSSVEPSLQQLFHIVL